MQIRADKTIIAEVRASRVLYIVVFWVDGATICADVEVQTRAKNQTISNIFWAI